MKRYLILFVLFMCSATVLFGQVPKDSDTVWVKEIGSDVLQVKFSPDGEKIYVGAANYKPFVVATATGETLREFEQSFVSVTAMDLSKDSNYLAVAGSSGEKASLIDVNTGSIVVDYKVPNEIFAKFDYKVIYSASLSSDMQYFAMLLRGNDSQLELISYVIIWNALTGEYVNSIDYPFTQRAIFSPLGNQIALCTDQADKPNKILLYNTIDWKQEQTLCCHNNMITDISFSPDGSLLASCGWDGEIKIWDVKNAKLIKEIMHPGHYGNVAWISNNYIASAVDYTLKLWDLSSNDELANIGVGTCNDIDVSTDGKYIVLGVSYNKTIKLLGVLNIMSANSNDTNSSESDTTSPNPSKGISKINFILPKSGLTKIYISDMLSNEITILYNGFLEQGEHNIQWIANNVPNGTYFCNIVGQDFSNTLKIMVQK